MKVGKKKLKELLGIEIKDDFAYVEILTENQYKSHRQNNLFHSLLKVFWESHCSSFESYRSMRFHYKEIAHLIEYAFTNDLKEETKQMLWRAVKLLPIDKSERNKVIELLRGKVLIEHSWGESTKAMAKVAIDQLLNDMKQSGVVTKKFEDILKAIGDWYEDTYPQTR